MVKPDAKINSEHIQHMDQHIPLDKLSRKPVDSLISTPQSAHSGLLGVSAKA